jgi:tRNA (guanine-N7-)-methyltransferase
VLDTIAPEGLTRIWKMNGSSQNEKISGGESSGRRPVRSYVLRGGRLTTGQERALRELWPRFGIENSAGLLDLKLLFGNSAPVIMEIGFGNGEATWQMASAHSEVNFIAVEVHRPGVGHLLLKIEEHAIGNIRIACADATEFLRKRIPENSLDGIRIYFPDPWPKKRHHKRRIIQPSFVRALASRMQTGAILHLATDWEPYAEYMLEVLDSVDDLVNLSSSGGYCDKPGWRPETKYEQRGQRLGHMVKDLLFSKAP